MTITQHALLYNFHTSNLIFEEIFVLNFLSMQPLPVVDLVLHVYMKGREGSKLLYNGCDGIYSDFVCG